MSGSNALLSLLSQDDFAKLKQDIHTHIDKIGGQIDEIAASEEEEDGQSNRQRQNRYSLPRGQYSKAEMMIRPGQPSHARNLTNNFIEEDQPIGEIEEDNAAIIEEIHDDDDDGVILTSYRGYEKPI